jgi:hypothetical protein
VPANVEVITLVSRRPRDAADVFGVGLENGDRYALLGEDVRGRQSGGAGADDADARRLTALEQSTHLDFGRAACPREA